MIKSSNASFAAVLWGGQTNDAVPAEYDGDLKADIAVRRPGNSVWYVLQSSNNALQAIYWGQSTDVPLPRR